MDRTAMCVTCFYFDNVSSLPRPLPPQMVEYLVGDGPNNRYALICSQCHSHNGMALRDEFEYTTFRCAYCYQLNPARKKKPTLEAVGGADSTHQTDAANGTGNNEQVKSC